MTAAAQTLIEKIFQLSPHRLAEVEDYVDFLRARQDQQSLAQAAASASQASFSRIWDNEDDAAYDRL